MKHLLIKGLWSLRNLGGYSSVEKVKRKLYNRFAYAKWIKNNSLPLERKLEVEKEIEDMPYKPLFSIILPIYNVEKKWLEKCIDSVINQLYPYWELCICNDGSNKEYIDSLLDFYRKKDARIKVICHEENQHISRASNSALSIANGDFIACLDHDDELSIDALYENAKLLNKYPDADMIYSDEDKVNIKGKRFAPYFKPDWSPELLLAQMYTCHLGVYRTDLVRAIGGFRVGFEGAQDYDLVLRLTEKTKKIFHIPKVLYHWREVSTSTSLNGNAKPYAKQAAKRAIEEALNRRQEEGWVEAIKGYSGRFRVHFSFSDTPLISLIILTRDKPELLERCLTSIFTNTTYPNYEVIVVDNGSRELETYRVLERFEREKKDKFKVVKIDVPFNYSKLNNEALKYANGELLVLLNNDTCVITPNWLEEMAGQALRSHIGAVGAKLLYEDNTIQHAGVILGIGGIAGHSHKGYHKNDSGYFGRLLSHSNYSAVTGACLMVKRNLFEMVGGLDERLSVALNDVDFCLRLTEKGFYNVVLSHVELYHLESKTRGYEDTKDKQDRYKIEKKSMYETWGSIIDCDPYYNKNLTLESEKFLIKFI